MKHKSIPWSNIVILIQEDQALIKLVNKFGSKSWLYISKILSEGQSLERTGKQCRERWHHHLDPLLTHREWTLREEKMIFQLSKVFGNRWSKIAKRLPGRSENSIKNYFYSTIRKNIRMVNKFLIRKVQVNTPFKELMGDPILKNLIFRSSEMLRKEIGEIIASKELHYSDILDQADLDMNQECLKNPVKMENNLGNALDFEMMWQQSYYLSMLYLSYCDRLYQFSYQT